MVEIFQIVENEIKSIESILKILQEKNIEIYYRSYPHLKEEFLNSSFKIKEELAKLKSSLLKDEKPIEDVEDLSFIMDIFITEVNQLSRLSLEENIINFKKIFVELKGSMILEEELKFEIDLDKIPDEIKEELIADIDDVKKCFQNKSYRGSLTFCGRIIELILGRKYFEKTGDDPLEKRWTIGVLIEECKKVGIANEPGLENLAKLINETRISSVHVKKILYLPTPEETKSLIELTNSILQRFFK